MYRSSGKIRSLSVEYIDSIDNHKVGQLLVEKCVRDPHDEIISANTIDNKKRILIAHSETKRRIIQFQLLDDYSNEIEITLWDLMEILGIRCGHRSLIVALKRCEQNILYAIEMERGVLFYSKDVTFSESGNMHENELDIYSILMEEAKIEKEDSISEIEIEDSIVKKKQNHIKQSRPTRKKDTNNQNASNKKITKTNNQNRPQKIAQFVARGVPTYTFYMSDYECLAKGQWLNDLIIDWYLMYLLSKVISDSDRQRTFIYSSLFFAVLRKEALDTDQLSYGSNHRYSKVRQFTGGMNIFEKDFVIIPINEDESHWYLIIICFLRLVDSDQIDDASQSLHSLSLSNDDNDNCEKKYPCILVFDSLKSSKKNRDIFLTREYLNFQYYEHYNERKDFSESNLTCDYPSVPKQPNSSDCGIYVLQYVESFFKNPITNFNPPLRSLKNWFSPEVVRKKRAHLAYILRKLSSETVGQVTPITFPDLDFGYSYNDEDENSFTASE